MKIVFSHCYRFFPSLLLSLFFAQPVGECDTELTMKKKSVSSVLNVREKHLCIWMVCVCLYCIRYKYLASNHSNHMDTRRANGVWVVAFVLSVYNYRVKRKNKSRAQRKHQLNVFFTMNRRRKKAARKCGSFWWLWFFSILANNVFLPIVAESFFCLCFYRRRKRFHIKSCFFVYFSAR